MKYRCKHCRQEFQRDSTKAWIKSFCSITGRTVHMTLVKPTKKKRK